MRGPVRSHRIPEIFKLRITLEGVKPSVWRAVLVPGDLTLADLHEVIQASMGWTDSHLHQFVVGDRAFGSPDPDEFDEIEDEERVQLHHVAHTLGASFTYEYDFGDRWRHRVEVRELQTPVPGTVYPLCVEGARACPPEDCGGPKGYATLLKTLKDPKSRGYREARELMGAKFDPGQFVLDGANQALGDLACAGSGAANAQSLKVASREVVQAQLRGDDPPETRKTLERLLSLGHSEKEAWNLIGAVVVSEVLGAPGDENGDYNRERFVKALRALPKLPWEVSPANDEPEEDEEEDEPD